MFSESSSTSVGAAEVSEDMVGLRHCGVEEWAGVWVSGWGGVQG